MNDSENRKISEELSDEALENVAGGGPVTSMWRRP